MPAVGRKPAGPLSVTLHEMRRRELRSGSPEEDKHVIRHITARIRTTDMNEQVATCQTNTDMAESDNGISCRQSGGRQQETAVGSGSALKSVAGTGISFELQEK